jgi:membrane-anchored mycosin MYCP
VRRATPAAILAVAPVLAVTLAGSAADMAAAADDLPPRISAVAPPGDGCVKPSRAGVTVASAAQRVLTPALAWPLTRGEGVTVAVLDTGLSQGSLPHLSGRVTRGPDEVNGGRTDGDCLGHGTFVAGLIAARPRPGTTVVGVAPRARVYAITVTDDSGATGPDVLAEGIDDAVRSGARIVDVSIASPRSSSRLKKAVRAALAKGALVIAPAVADDQSYDGPVYPASLPGVVSVVNSVTRPGADAPPRATLAAPGDVVLSTGPGGGAFVGSGASYSSALVAGTAALVDAYHPGLTLAQRRRRLVDSAYPSTVGARVVDPYAAVTAILPGERDVAAEPAPTRGAVAPIPPPAVDPAWPAGLAVGGVGALVLLLALGAVATVRRGRARNWRPDPS